MKAEFEVKHKDLLGRIGVLHLGGKRVETPTFVPVINPVNQVIPPMEMKKLFRCQIVITNAYILFKRFKETVVEKGVHGFIDFDGVVMTDSGGYQVLVYGDVAASAADIAVFQEAIGSDIAVPLDRPTGLVSRREAEKTVEETLANVRLTMKLVEPESRCVWVGPVQGGLYRDLVARCVDEYEKLGFSLYCLGSPVPLMTAYRYKQLTSMISSTRGLLGPVKPLHLFGAGHPMVFAFAIALGVDLFDSASYALFASEDRYLTQDGTTRIENLAYLPCSCRICLEYSARELKSLEKPERFKLLALHNLHVCFEEVNAVKQALWEGRLFELLEKRAKAHPALFDAFTNMFSDEDTVKTMMIHTPVTKKRGLFLYDENSIKRPEYRRIVENLETFSAPQSNTAVIVSHRAVTSRNISNLLEKIAETISSADFDVYVAGTPFGLIPLSVYNVYPTSQTNYTENLMKKLEKNLHQKISETITRNGYKKVYVVDFGPDTYPGFLKDLARALEITYVKPKKRLNTSENKTEEKRNGPVV
ncbi:MAG: tRNA guanosine(15) transglycosylase TgtA [Candidatus Caldarchaeum sp.]|nr:tRNA guanosine(15) transglycosylase TgtA [Candidatus Caldarchaeum sp.]MCX8201198.1 tRNA guanosine(15) transglycosylase TgtA [Candidatus Caldarchaeum sp.]